MTVDADQPEALSLFVEAAARVNTPNHPSQNLWCHGACLATRLHESVPFLADAFDTED